MSPPTATTRAADEEARPAHHTDAGFTNPGHGVHGNPSPAIAFPFFVRRIASTLFGKTGVPPSRIDNDGAFLRANALASVPTVTWVGHSTLLVQMGHTTFLTDPTWSSTASPVPVGPRRYVEPGVSLEALPPIDFVVVSHNHYDHMDLGTLAALVGGGTHFLVPLGNRAVLDGAGISPVIELDWWESVEIGGVSVHCVPARHWSRRGLFDLNEALWSGWVVVAEDRRFYFAGDTGTFDGFGEIAARLGSPDLAAVPIGAYEPVEMMQPVHLDPEEALEAVQALGAERSVAVHFGTFDLTDEPLDEPPQRYLDASLRAGRGPDQDWVLRIGETRKW